MAKDGSILPDERFFDSARHHQVQIDDSKISYIAPSSFS